MGAKISKSRRRQPVYGYEPDWWPERLPRDPKDVPERQHPRDIPEPQRPTNQPDPNEDKNSDTSSVSTVSPSHYSHEHTSTIQNSPPRNTNPSPPRNTSPPQEYSYPIHYHPTDNPQPEYNGSDSDNHQLPESSYAYYTRDYDSPGYRYHKHQPEESDHEYDDADRFSDWLFNSDPSDYLFKP